MKDPLISVIIPCYNQSSFLNEALISVYNQTYSNWECIIVNDGSTDNTDKIAKFWMNKDKRFKYIEKENEGRSIARNEGLKIASGIYIQFLDSDDFLDRQKLELSLLVIEDSKDFNVVITNFKMFSDNMNKFIEPYCKLSLDLFNYESVLFKWETVFSIPIHCGLFKACLIKNFEFPEELSAKEDWFLWIHLFKNESKIYFIDKPLVYYRRHQYNTTNNSEYLYENHQKAIDYLKHVISEDEYMDYLIFELQQKYNENKKLHTTIFNYQNSKTYKIAKKINDTHFSKFIFKLLMKLKN